MAKHKVATREELTTQESQISRLARDGYRFSALVLAVVESEPFLSRPIMRGNP